MKRPEMHEVASRNLHSIGHDASGLFVCFRNRDGSAGATYHYPDGTKEHFHEMKASPSPGGVFHSKIRPYFSGSKLAD